MGQRISLYKWATPVTRGTSADTNVSLLVTLKVVYYRGASSGAPLAQVLLVFP